MPSIIFKCLLNFSLCSAQGFSLLVVQGGGDVFFFLIQVQRWCLAFYTLHWGRIPEKHDEIFTHNHILLWIICCLGTYPSIKITRIKGRKFCGYKSRLLQFFCKPVLVLSQGKLPFMYSFLLVKAKGSVALGIQSQCTQHFFRCYLWVFAEWFLFLII